MVVCVLIPRENYLAVLLSLLPQAQLLSGSPQIPCHRCWILLSKFQGPHSLLVLWTSEWGWPPSDWNIVLPASTPIIAICLSHRYLSMAPLSLLWAFWCPPSACYRTFSCSEFWLWTLLNIHNAAVPAKTQGHPFIWINFFSISGVTIAKCFIMLVDWWSC